jgi:DNA-binding transcriptional LysR family regulator
MGLSQPTLSKALARLERENKVRLFERLPRGMRPTEVGRAFLAYAERLDACGDDLYAALRDLRQGRTGTVKLGVGQGVPDDVVSALVQELLARGVHVDLSGGMTDNLQRAVALGELEFALLGLGETAGTALTVVAPCPDPMEPMVAAGNTEFAGKRNVAWSTLARANWIVPASGTATHAEFERNFRSHGVEPPAPAVVSRSSHRELALAQATGAILLLPGSMARDPKVASGLKRVGPAGGWRSQRTLSIIHRAGGYLGPGSQLAIQTVTRLVSRLVKRA